MQAEVDHIADADLILRDDEDAVQHVLDDVLCTEAEACTDRGSEQGERAERVRGECVDHQHDGDDAHRNVDDVLQDRPERAGALNEADCRQG